MRNQENNKLRYLRSALPDPPAPERPGLQNDDRPTGRERRSTYENEFISVPEWCRRVGCAPDSGYRAARRDEIPGLFRIGRLMRINWPVFVDAIARGSRSSGPASPDGPVS
jgi:hypothetical protein